MPEALAAALALPGLGWMALAALLAGLVRGFSGFGTAMIFLPVAGQHVSPVEAIVILVVMDLFGPMPNLPRALRDGHPADVMRLLAGTLLLLPVGLMLLAQMQPEVFRTAVGVVALVLVACLVLGLRYRGTLRPPMIYGIGGVSGFLGGAAGVAGPPVILFYMASPLPAAAIRANTMLFLFLVDIVLIAMFWLRGELLIAPVMIGLALALPTVLGNLAGAAIFRPGHERVYRAVAYLVVVISALSGLPIWG